MFISTKEGGRGPLYRELGSTNLYTVYLNRQIYTTENIAFTQLCLRAVKLNDRTLVTELDAHLKL